MRSNASIEKWSLNNMSEDIKAYKEGFYHLYSPSEEAPVLVHGYHCTDLDDAFVFGFNIHDGGGLVAASDLTDETIVKAVEIVEPATK